MEITPTERRALRARAHHLEPVVTVGHHGLTSAVLHEIEVALAAHELVKVRVLSDDRQAREAMLAQASDSLRCAAVQHVGKVLVLWRPNPEQPKPKPAAAPVPRKSAARRAPVDPVRERRRATVAAKAPRGDQSRKRRSS